MKASKPRKMCVCGNDTFYASTKTVQFGGQYRTVPAALVCSNCDISYPTIGDE